MTSQDERAIQAMPDGSLPSAQVGAFPPGGGEAGALIRAYDWASSPLGEPASWPQSLKTLVDVMLSAGQPMFIGWGPERTMLYNDAYILLMDERHPGIGRPFLEVWADIRHELGPLIDRVFAGEAIHMEDIALHPVRSGLREEAHFTFSYTPVHNEAGEVSGVFCVCSEISDQVRAVERLRASETGLQVALKAGRFGTWSLDLKTFRLETSDTCRLNFGRPIDEAFSYDALRDAVHPSDRQRMASAVELSVSKGQDYDIEYRIVTPDGETRWVHIRGQPSYDLKGSPLRMSGVSIDLTERRRAEDELQEIAERLRLATENAEIGFWDVDPVHDVLIWPARTKAMFGISPQASITMRDFYDGLHPEDREATSVAYAAAADPDRRSLYDVEYRTIGKEDGLIRWVAAKGRGVFDETGLCTRIIGTAIDITARKRSEDELRELNETLEARVAARTAELEVAHEQLRQSQKLEAIGQLTGGVAHDFNNLLTVIRGSVELLRRPDLSPDRRTRYLDAVGDTADRAAALTQQLLAFARRQALKPEPFDVGASLSDVEPILATLLGSRIGLEITIPSHKAFALADRGQFDTAIVNMAVNARDAMDGVGHLKIAAGAVAGVPAIRNHSPQNGDFIAVTVTDTGSGIAPDQLDRVFEPFYTTKPAGAGTGLGLSQVFGFAKQSGGDLRVDSAPGEGATFTIYLPRVYAEDGPTPETKNDGPESGEGACVLVVEDNKSVGEFAADALKTLGYDCVLASDGESALAELEGNSGRFDVVFSDVVMPGMDGLELGAMIRKRFPTVPVILTSGYSHVLAQNGQHGFDLLHKPYSIDQLSRVLRKAVSWKEKQSRP